MNKAERVELLRDQVWHNRIETAELDKECEKYGIDKHEEVLSPIGFNTCDRCGAYGDSETDFCWFDWFDWQDDNPDDVAIQKAVAEEKTDYCAVCWDCVNKLKEKGRAL